IAVPASAAVRIVSAEAAHVGAASSGSAEIVIEAVGLAVATRTSAITAVSAVASTTIISAIGAAAACAVTVILRNRIGPVRRGGTVPIAALIPVRGSVERAQGHGQAIGAAVTH